MNPEIEQKIVTFSSEGAASIGEAVQKAAASLSARLTEWENLDRRPIVVSVSHTSGWIGHTGHYASIVAAIKVAKDPFAD